MPGSSGVRALVGWVRHRTTPRHAEGPAWLQHLQGTAFPAYAKQVPADSRMVLVTSVINNSKTLSPGCKPALYYAVLCLLQPFSSNTSLSLSAREGIYHETLEARCRSSPQALCTRISAYQSSSELCSASLSSPARFSPVPPSAAASRRKGLVLLPCLLYIVEPWLIICYFFANCHQAQARLISTS